MTYDVTILALRPGTQPRALERLEAGLRSAPGHLLACWFSDIGALNQIFVLREFASESEAGNARDAQARAGNPFGIGEFVAEASSDSYAPFDFIKPIAPGEQGPYFEVRTYVVKPDGLTGTIEGWRAALEERLKLSPVIAAMYAVTGVAPRFMHIWPYRSLDERHRIRGAAVQSGIWPPPGGPDRLVAMRNDIYLPTKFSPLR